MVGGADSPLGPAAMPQRVYGAASAVTAPLEADVDSDVDNDVYLHAELGDDGCDADVPQINDNHDAGCNNDNAPPLCSGAAKSGPASLFAGSRTAQACALRVTMSRSPLQLGCSGSKDVYNFHTTVFVCWTLGWRLQRAVLRMKLLSYERRVLAIALTLQITALHAPAGRGFAACC